MQQHGHSTITHILATLDMYRKIPIDLVQGTKHGSVLSWISVFVMMTLFTLETRDFVRTRLVADLALDVSTYDKKDDSSFQRRERHNGQSAKFEEQIRINFNITMMDLKCDYVAVDVLSVLGTDQNVKRHISKQHLDADGVRRGYAFRNRHQHDIPLYDETVTETIEELIEYGEDAIHLTPDTFDELKEQHQFLFVDYYAMWCSHCQALMPTWETLAKLMRSAAEEIVMHNVQKERHMAGNAAVHGDELSHDPLKEWTSEDFEHAIHLELPVRIAKIDCVEFHRFCSQQGVKAYPTLRLYVDSQPYGADYSGARTVLAFTDYLATVEEEYLKDKGKVDYADEIARRVREGHVLEVDESEYRADPRSSDDSGGGVSKPKNMKGKKRILRKEWIEQDHPGCLLTGYLMLDRVPGNFHVLARSEQHSLVPSMTNVSHEIHHLSFGEPYAYRLLEMGLVNSMILPADIMTKTNPMDGNVYITTQLHEAYHHYLKIIRTNYGGGGDRKAASWSPANRGGTIYQIIPQSQLAYYKTNVVPAAKFQFDYSPVAVTYRTKSRKWYDYLTSLMAIIGGTFTVLGMLDNTITFAEQQRNRRLMKQVRLSQQQKKQQSQQEQHSHGQ